MFKSLTSSLTTILCSILSHEEFNSVFLIPQLPSPSEHPSAFALVLVSFILFILFSATNPLVLFHQLSHAASKTLDAELVSSSVSVSEDLEMKVIAECISKDDMKTNSKPRARPPEGSTNQANMIYSSARILKASSASGSPTISSHQKARRSVYNVLHDSAPIAYTDNCYNAIFYENRINQLMNRDPFLFKPHIGPLEVFSGIDTMRYENKTILFA